MATQAITIAMDIGDDDIREDYISSMVLDSPKSSQSGDALSPEDVAWVDSCFNKDFDISDTDWTSMTDALLDILSFQPDSRNTSAAGGADAPTTEIEVHPSGMEAKTTGGADAPTREIELLPSSMEAEIAQALGRTDNVPVSTYEEEEENSENDILKSKRLSQTSFENAFLPSYNDDGLKVSKNFDFWLDLGFSAYDMEPSTEDIFRVWDIEIPAEEDELIKQLNKALAGAPSLSTPSTSDDSSVWKGVDEESVDDLIAGIIDLSLTSNSSLKRKKALDF